MTQWHAHARCARSECGWTHDQIGEVVGQPADLAARKHEEAEQHATTVAMHRALYCKTLGCPEPAPDAAPA